MKEIVLIFSNIMNKKNKSVLIITSHYPPNVGGVESHLKDLVKGLNEHKWDVVVSTYQPLASKIRGKTFEHKKGLEIYRMPWLSFNLFHYLATYPFLEFLFLFPGLFLQSFMILLKKRSMLNVIHCQGLVPTAIGVTLKLFFRKKVISSTHNLYFFPKDNLYSKAAKIIFSFSDLVLTPTRGAARELISIGVSSNKIRQFKYWIDLKTFKKIEKNQAKKLTGMEGFSVLFVGRLLETKGIEIIIKLLKNLDEGIKMVIVGSGPMSGKISACLGENSNLKFLGRIENSKLPLYYSSADLQIVPSIVDEGFGFVVMEALACGTPVLASNKIGLSDAVGENTGRLLKADKKSFADMINFYYRNKKKLHGLEINTRKYANQNFSNKNIELILKAYG